MSITPDKIGMVVGTLLSLAFTLIPGLNAKFAGLTSEMKQSVMAILSIIAGAGIFGLSCLPNFSFLGLTVACDTQGLYGLVIVVVATIVANQSTDRIIPKPKAVTDAKDARLTA